MDFGRTPGNEDKVTKLLFKEKKKGGCLLLLRSVRREESRGGQRRVGQADGTWLAEGSQRGLNRRQCLLWYTLVAVSCATWHLL